MLRFALNTKLILVTTAGVISCTIVRATNDFIFCKDVEYQGMDLGKLYIDRNAIVGFSDIYTKKQEEENMNAAIKKTARIIKFCNYKAVNNKG